MGGIMDLILVAQRVPGPRANLSNAVQVGIDIASESAALCFYIGHEALEAKGIYRGQPGLILGPAIDRLLSKGEDHGT